MAALPLFSSVFCMAVDFSLFTFFPLFLLSPPLFFFFFHRRRGGEEESGRLKHTLAPPLLVSCFLLLFSCTYTDAQTHIYVRTRSNNNNSKKKEEGEKREATPQHQHKKEKSCTTEKTHGGLKTRIAATEMLNAVPGKALGCSSAFFFVTGFPDSLISYYV
jgi:hypothetical protein